MHNQFNGWLGEQATAWGLSQGLDPRYYKRIDDVIIPNGRGGTAQIDHVIISQFGLFVVETKNRNGLIVGTAAQRTWRQIRGDKSYEFQNPLWQNEAHIQALVRLLALPKAAFHSIIYFCGDAQFRHKMPFHVRTEGVTTVVHSKNIILLWPDEINHAWNQLWACKRNGNLSLENHLLYLERLRREVNRGRRQWNDELRSLAKTGLRLKCSQN